MNAIGVNTGLKNTLKGNGISKEDCGMKKIYRCEICEKPVPEYEPRYCCDGQSCGCMGLPIEPCVCSSACDKALHSGIGTSYEQRRIAAGIEKFNLPRTIRLKEMCTALCLPPDKTVLPAGAIGELSEQHQAYLFSHFPGYTSSIPVKFVLISDKFEPV